MAAQMEGEGWRAGEEELRERIKMQVACEERAFRLVEQLLEETVSEEYLLSSCQLLQPHHYADIVEERAIDKRCGYPICSSPLGKIPTKKYHISTKHNAIYDITERKNFCSDQCLAASKFLAKQIPTSPLWMRNREPPSPISLLSRQHSKGEKGEEVIGLSTLSNDPELQTYASKKKKQDACLQQGGSKAASQSQENSPAAGEPPATVEEGLGSRQDSSPEATQTSAGSAEEEVCARLSATSIQDGTPSSSQHELTERLGHLTLEQSEDSSDPAQSSACVCPANLRNRQEKDGDTSAVGGDSMTAPMLREPGKSHDQSEVQSSRPQGATSSEDRSQRPGESKTEYLMRLLDRRKHLLAKMADIQDMPVKGGNSSSPSVVPSSKEGKVSHSGQGVEKKEPDSAPGGESAQTSSQNQVSLETFETENTDSISNTSDSSPKSTPASQLTPATSPAATAAAVGRPGSATSPTKTGGQARKGRKKSPHQSSGNSTPTSSPLEQVARQVQAWVTSDTLDFLAAKEPRDVTGTGRSRQELEAACLKLEAIAAARERELERLEEEESRKEEERREEQGGKSKGRLPAYKILAEQTQEFSIKVQQFFSGDRARIDAEVTEKESSNEKVYLPPVDCHDQMHIRRRIVLDRLDKVLPELLKSLSLTIQDVSAHLRELVHSFSLSSDNISFRPAQWMLVTLILLQMLSQREGKIQAGLAKASSVQFISILLGGVGLSQADLESTTQRLLQSAGGSIQSAVQQ